MKKINMTTPEKIANEVTTQVGNPQTPPLSKVLKKLRATKEFQCAIAFFSVSAAYSASR
jgi:hypothetical protein